MSNESVLVSVKKECASSADNFWMVCAGEMAHCSAIIAKIRNFFIRAKLFGDDIIIDHKYTQLNVSVVEMVLVFLIQAVTSFASG